MKLYEFDYIDNQKLSASDLQSRVGELMVTESEAQSWAPDYTFRQWQPVEQLPNGALKYSFEVIGRYLESVSDHFESDVRTSEQFSDDRAAKEVNP